MIFFLLLLSFSFAETDHSTCNDAQVISLGDLDENGVFEVTGDTTHQSGFCWVCNPRLQCPTTYQQSHFFKFVLKSNTKLLISTCNEHTNFDTQIAVLQTCDQNKAHTCAAINDDDTQASECNGGKSNIIFEALAETVYYVAVSGASSQDVGLFKLIIRKFENPQAASYDQAYLVEKIPQSFPGVITRDSLTRLPEFTSDHWGTWYKYKPVDRTPFFVDTCGDYDDNYDFELFVLKCLPDDVCTLSNHFLDHRDDDCGMSPRIHIEDPDPDYYYYFELSVKNLPLNASAQYRLNFRVNAAENYQCEGAVGIDTFPFKATVKLADFIAEGDQGCNPAATVGSWYSIVGDGRKYLIDTCSTIKKTGGAWRTGVEVYANCDRQHPICHDQGFDNCGDDGYVETTLERGTIYYIRAVSLQHDSIVTLRVERVSETNNTKCAAAASVALFKDGDTFEDLAVDITKAEPSSSGCKEEVQKQGVWYKFVSVHKEKQHIKTLVTPLDHTYDPVIEIHRSCSPGTCVTEWTSTEIATFEFGSPDNVIYVFATALYKDGGKYKYGIFDVWFSLAETVDGESHHDPIIIETFPYTHIGYITSVEKFISECYKENHSGQEVDVYGAWYKFTVPAKKLVTLTTCAVETQIDTALEVVTMTDNDLTKRKCVVSNADSDSPGCGKQALVILPDYDEPKEVYGVVVTDPTSQETPGTYRLSAYIDEEPENDVFDAPITISNETSEHFIYITKAQPTYIDGVEGTSKGTYYKYTTPDEGYLHILVDDLSQAAAIVVIYNDGSCEKTESGDTHIKGEVSIYNHTEHPYGSTGVYAKEGHFKKGTTVSIFVGGEGNSVGIIHFRVNFEQGPAPSTGDDDDDNTAVIIGVCVSLAVVLLAAVIIAVGIIVGVFLYRKKNRGREYDSLT